LSKETLNIRNFNNDFLLINTTSDGVSLSAIGKYLFEQQFDFVEEVIVTETELCLKLNAHFDDSKLDLLQAIEQKSVLNSQCYQLPVYFTEEEDWTTVISTTGFSRSDIIEKLTATEFSIAMFGFLPGFLYLAGLDPSLQVPRKTVPSKYIKANSIALGGKYLGLYSLDSPGGWHVIGKTPVSILQMPELPPLPLNLGDTIRCCAISEEEFRLLQARQISLIDYNA
jgi:KipI family sensor histidine kinase inhibitor